MTINKSKTKKITFEISEETFADLMKMVEIQPKEYEDGRTTQKFILSAARLHLRKQRDARKKFERLENRIKYEMEIPEELYDEIQNECSRYVVNGTVENFMTQAIDQLVYFESNFGQFRDDAVVVADWARFVHEKIKNKGKADDKDYLFIWNFLIDAYDERQEGKDVALKKNFVQGTPSLDYQFSEAEAEAPKVKEEQKEHNSIYGDFMPAKRELKEKRMSLLVTPSLYRGINEAAQFHGISMNELVGRVMEDFLEKEAEKVKKQGGKDVAFSAEFLNETF